MRGSLLIRNAQLDGRVCDVRIADGAIAEIGTRLRAPGPDLDARGGELISGLIDHHIHLFATAALAHSLAVTPEMDFAAEVRQRAATLPPERDLRVTGYHDSFYGPLDAARLDALIPDRPMRVQYRTGSLWVLNTRALEIALRRGDGPECIERDARGQPTGRIWRGDAWLRTQFATTPPSLADLGHDLARQGVTHLTDASVSTDDATAGLFTAAQRNGELPQHLMLMSRHALRQSAEWTLGPLKILLDDHALPPLETMIDLIHEARQQARAVAVHCVAAGELAMTLAAFDAAGARDGDRIEHGGIIVPEAIGEIKRLGLTVVTQPGFIAERGDVYLKEVESNDHASLYRCASLIVAGIKTAGSTDAPYTQPDIWAAIRAAICRATPSGVVLGGEEQLPPRRALALFQTCFDDPGGPVRRIEVGAPADLALLRDTFETIAADGFAEPVTATIIEGKVI